MACSWNIKYKNISLSLSASFPLHLLTLNTYVAPPPPPPPPFTWVLFTIGPLCSRQILFSMPLDCGEGERCQVTEELLSWMSDAYEKAEHFAKPQLLRVWGFSITMVSKYQAEISKRAQEARGKDRCSLYKTAPVRIAFLLISCLPSVFTWLLICHTIVEQLPVHSDGIMSLTEWVIAGVDFYSLTWSKRGW